MAADVPRRIARRRRSPGRARLGRAAAAADLRCLRPGDGRHFRWQSGWGTYSLGVFGVGLGVLADLTGSAVLIWRFPAEPSPPVPSCRMETPAAAVVANALAVARLVPPGRA